MKKSNLVYAFAISTALLTQPLLANVSYAHEVSLQAVTKHIFLGGESGIPGNFSVPAHQAIIITNNFPKAIRITIDERGFRPITIEPGQSWQVTFGRVDSYRFAINDPISEQVYGEGRLNVVGNFRS